MKNFLKWTAIIIGGIVLLNMYTDMEVEKQRWAALFFVLAYVVHLFGAKLEAIEYEVKQLHLDLQHLKRDADL